jgi:hypothetical protein
VGSLLFSLVRTLARSSGAQLRRRALDAREKGSDIPLSRSEAMALATLLDLAAAALAPPADPGEHGGPISGEGSSFEQSALADLQIVAAARRERSGGA